MSAKPTPTARLGKLGKALMAMGFLVVNLPLAMRLGFKMPMPPRQPFSYIGGAIFVAGMIAIVYSRRLQKKRDDA